MPNTKDFTRQQRIIDTLREHGKPLSIAEIGAIIGEPTRSTSSLVNHLAQIGTLKLHAARHSGGRDSPATWVLKPAAPRQHTYGTVEDTRPYTGPNWAASTSRPGCLDHTQHPSRRGDQLVPYTGQMMHLTSNAKG